MSKPSKIVVNVKKRITPVIKKRTPTAPASAPAIPHYVSIDVAIKTLAYCIMTEDGEPIEWNIINCANGNNKLLCKDKLKSGANAGKECGKKAYYQHTDHPRKGLCQTHHKGHPDKNDYVRNVTVNNTPEYELITTLYQHLDRIKGLLDVKCVLIERQPNKAREKIKHVAYALFSYFVLRGLDKTQFEVKFIDAKNKLTLYDGPPLSCHLKDQYARNKWYGKKYCEYILKQKGHTKAIQTYNKFSKQDDLADCYLQGLWYIKYGQHGKKAPITSSHQKLVYRENNLVKYKKVRAYKPIAKIEKTGRYTLSNIKYLIMKQHDPLTTPKLKAAIEFYFDSVDYLMENI